MQFRKPLLAAGSAAAVIAMASAGWASSHREAPGITEQPKIDGTDFYMFRSYESGRQGYVTFIANYQPLQAPYGGPNYFTMDPDAIYEIHIDNDGDAVEDLTFQFKFDNSLANDTGIELHDRRQEGGDPAASGRARSPSADPTATLDETEHYNAHADYRRSPQRQARAR